MERRAIERADLLYSEIDRNTNQPRKTFKEESLKEMASSIASYGVLQPLLLVKQENGRYLIIAGERRFRAATMAGLKKVPAIVRDFTEQQIQAAMRSLMKDKTCFVIAHRLSTIQNADEILVVQKGDIMEQGTHEELMQRGGIYAGLYRSQFQ